MSKQKYVEINGETFELCAEKFDGYAFDMIKQRKKCIPDIYDTYKKPSVYKKDVWLRWEKWAFSVVDCTIWIAGHNCNFFTIEGWCVYLGREYYLRITHRHNYAYEVKR